MPKHEMLNNVDHKDLRIHTGHGAEFGDNLMCTLAIPSEFHSLQGDYPIFFHRNSETGKFLPMAMFGFEEGENLFLEGHRWRASYIPLMVQRGPFLIGFQESVEDGERQKNMVISVDMDNPRVGHADGEPVFQPFGGNSEYTERIVQVLQDIDQGQAAIEQLVAALEEHELIEPFSLDITLDNGSKHSLMGFHTIHQEKLAALGGDVLADFSRRGILQAAYMVVASMTRIARLIELKNRRVSGG
jgi:hypothetical protein